MEGGQAGRDYGLTLNSCEIARQPGHGARRCRLDKVLGGEDESGTLAGVKRLPHHDVATRRWATAFSRSSRGPVAS